MESKTGDTPYSTVEGSMSKAPQHTFSRLVVAAAFLAGGLYLANSSVQAILSSFDSGVWILPYGVILLAGVAFVSRFRTRPIDIGAISLAIAGIWTFVSDSQPFTDFAGFYRLASTFATDHSLEALAAAKSTTTVLYYGLWMDLAGTNVAAARIGGAVALGAAAFFVAALGRRLGYPAFAWRFAGLAIGLSPALVAYSPVVSSEGILLATLSAGLYCLVAVLDAHDPRAWAVSSGLLLGLAYLAVPTAAVFGVGAFLLVAGRWFTNRSRVDRRAAAALLIGLVVFPVAQTLLNWHVSGLVSPSPYPWAAMAVLQGTSIECRAGWCPEDLELVGFLDDEVPKAEADSRAWRLARDRWVDDPFGLAWFSVTTKQRVLWQGESELVHWALYKSSHYEAWNSSGVFAAIGRGADAFYFTLMALLIPAMIVAARLKLLGTTEAAFAFGIALAGLIHTVLSVQQRYHLIYLPFIVLLIGLMADRFRERFARSWLAD